MRKQDRLRGNKAHKGYACLTHEYTHSNIPQNLCTHKISQIEKRKILIKCHCKLQVSQTQAEYINQGMALFLQPHWASFSHMLLV